MINDNNYKILSDFSWNPSYSGLSWSSSSILLNWWKQGLSSFCCLSVSTLTLLGREFSHPQMENVCMHAKLVQLCLTLHPCGLYPTSVLCPWDSPGKNTEVGCHAILQQMENILPLCWYQWEREYSGRYE